MELLFFLSDFCQVDQLIQYTEHPYTLKVNIYLYISKGLERKIIFTITSTPTNKTSENSAPLFKDELCNVFFKRR